jgi:hypothetical protein
MSDNPQSDERLHPVDPGDWSWSESWFLSFIDLDGGPACTFRVGITPNQGRAMLWCFLYVDGAWVTVEESRLAYGDFDLTGEGVSYDRWALRFSCVADEPLETGQFSFEGFGLVRSGPDAGARVPFSIDLRYTAAAPVHGTGVGDDDLARTTFPTGRFEQSITATGTVVVDGAAHGVRAGAHRDKSWGPRDWRHNFVIGDIQDDGRELYFVGRSFPGEAGGYERIGGGTMQPLHCIDGAIDYDDANRTIRPSRMVFETLDGSARRIAVDVTPAAPSIQFDIAHAVEVPEHWLYYRALVDARVTGWDGPVRGWFEAGRHGVA